MELFRGGPDSGEVLCAILVIKEGLAMVTGRHVLAT